MDKDYIDLWEDRVRIKSLIGSIALCVTLAMCGYNLAWMEAPGPLFMGLGGAFLGFLIATILIKPKRKLVDGSTPEKEE